MFWGLGEKWVGFKMEFFVWLEERKWIRNYLDVWLVVVRNLLMVLCVLDMEVGRVECKVYFKEVSGGNLDIGGEEVF